jgi:Carboxypeptidase regulatory-like domain
VQERDLSDDSQPGDLKMSKFHDSHAFDIVDARLKLILAALLLLTGSSFGQLSSSSVTGLVKDTRGAIIPGATVALQNVDTNVLRETVSNGAGNYSFESVPPGRYTLAFTAGTFQKEEIAAFDVSVAQAVAINAVLNVGSVMSTVVVQAQGIQVEGSTAQLGTLIGQKEVTDLPLNGRNFTQLLQLTPGATPIDVGQNKSGGGSPVLSGSAFTYPSINGQPNRATLYLLDGVNDNNAWFNSYAVAPIIDSIQEFKINSHSDAQYGQVTGGVVNVSTKAGTNNFHGSAWEYIRNNDFDAETYFPSLALYHQNQFGSSLGGPVQLPKIYNGKDKTFFFIAFEGFRFSEGNGTFFLQPTAAQLGESTWGGAQVNRYGDFSTATTGVAGCTGTTSTSTAKCQLYDPTIANAQSNRPAYVGNQIPVSEMNPYSIAFIHTIFSAPIVIPGVAPTVDNGEITSPTRQTQYNYSARVDQHIGIRDFIFFRYSGQQLETITPGTIPHLFSDNKDPSQQYGLNWMHIFGPSTSMQVQYGRTHVTGNNITAYDIHNMATIFGTAGAYSNFIDGVTLLPVLTTTGYFSGGESNSPASNLSSIHEFQGSMSRQIGSHQLQAGGGWDQINYTQYQRTGLETFSGTSTNNFSGNPGSTVPSSGASTQTGNGLADFLLGYPSTEQKRNLRITERPGGIADIYLQDSWKTTPRLTVNYGLRYDRTVVPQYGTPGTEGEAGGIETGDLNFRIGEYIVQKLPPTCAVLGHAPCIPNSSGTLPADVRVALHSRILHGTKTNFGPRFGLAYRANTKLAIRGGFGITFDNWAAAIQLPQQFQGQWPDVGNQELDNTNTPGTAFVSPQNPFSAAPSGALPGPTPFSGNVGGFVDPYIKNPYSEQWNAGIEQQFGNATVFALNYVGSESHRLDLGDSYNTGTPAAGISFAARRAAGTAGQPFPYIEVNRWDRAAGSGAYNALQASLVRRFVSGFAYQVAYTWSKAIDEGQSGWFGAEGSSLEDPYNPRGSRSVSAYNVPQLLTVNLNYEIPFGQGRQFDSSNKIVNYIVGNWQINSIFLGRSGQNFSVTSSGDIANTGNASSSPYERANLIGTPHLSNPSKQEWFNTAAFATPASGTLGNSGRNILLDQTYWNLDTSVIREFPIRESLQLQFRAEAFNVLNHPVLGTPGASTTTPSTLGVVTTTANSQRLMQFAVKVVF